MRLLTLLIISTLVPVANTQSWNYLLFVQIWPGSWMDGNVDYWGIHGIWPNDNNGSYPVFCPGKQFQEKNITTLEPLLEKYWTDYKNPVNFWKHEYNKHGVCAHSDPPLDTEYKFFLTGLQLREQMDLYNILANSGIVPSNSRTYTMDQITSVIKKNITYTPLVYCTKKNNRTILDHVMVCLHKNITLFECNDVMKKEHQRENDCGKELYYIP